MKWGKSMDWSESLDQAIKEYLPDLRVAKEEPMCRHTSFHIGGPARRMAFPTSAEQLVLLLHFARECGAQVLVIGNGTNLLVPDAGLNRLVIDTSAGMNGVELLDDGITLGAWSGCSLARLADFACKKGLTGLEFAHGIPGTVGGGICMNAGAYGGEMKQVVTQVSILDPEKGVISLDGDELAFDYRRSVLTNHPDWVVLYAEFRLMPGDEIAIRAKMEDLKARRKKSQPLEWPSAGSTFKRPQGYYAGTLIDQCGLKGMTVGRAQVSEKHAGFVINLGGATFADVMGLIGQVQDCVEKERGVRLEPEVKIIL